MLEVNLYNLGYCDESEYTRVVCVSRYQGKFVFCFNKKRNGKIARRIWNVGYTIFRRFARQFNLSWYI